MIAKTRSARLQPGTVVRCSLLLVLCLSACTDVGLGVPGTGAPLPPGGLPAAQTLEGGAQIRVTQAGFQKLTSVLPAVLHDGVGQVVCVASLSQVGLGDACYTSQGACSPGCAFDVEPAGAAFQLLVTNQQTLRLTIQASATASVQIDPADVVFVPISPCTASVTVGQLDLDADISLGVDPGTGALSATLAGINGFDASEVSYSGCPGVDVSGMVGLVVDSFVSTWLTDAVMPALEAALDQFVPAQLELAALVDLPAAALVGPAASTGRAVETRIVPGGYANLTNGGLSLGVVTGFNSDADPQSRSAGQASEPHPCVAGLSAPDLSLPPFAFSTSSRGTFVVPPAGAFLGTPADPAADLLVGVSRSALDLAGHHIVASGGLCLTIGADQLGFARRDALDDLLGLPLAAADEELRFVVRPQQPVRFDIGTGSALSPHLTARLPGLQIEVDAVSGGNPTPALRLTADVEVGLQLGTRHDPGLPARLETTRSTLAVSNPTVAVLDPRYAAVDAEDLDGLAATLADVVFSTLGADAGTVLLSSVGGFDVDGVSVSRVSTASDDFLAVSGSLGTAPPILEPPAPEPQPLSTALVLPTPGELRTALLAGDNAALPTLHLELPTADGARPLEHAWRTAGGAWRPYVATGDLVIRDRSFAWQGERTVELRSRVVGDDGTTSPIGSTTVSIDWAPPTLFVAQKSFGTHLVVPARDAVSTTLEWAMGRIGESEPATAWTSDPNLDATAALALGNDLVVHVRDAEGNAAHAAVQLLDPAQLPPNDGCAGAALLAGPSIQDVSLATGAPADPVSACGAGDRSVWFSFVPARTGTAAISTGGSGYSTVVSVWPQAQGCAGLTTEVACGQGGASVPVQAGVPLLVEVQRGTPGGTGDLQVHLTPEPDAGAAAALACAALAWLTRRAHGRPGSELR